jgi:hypothetical protein
LSIKKLTKNSPSLKDKFDQLDKWQKIIFVTGIIKNY